MNTSHRQRRRPALHRQDHALEGRTGDGHIRPAPGALHPCRGRLHRGGPGSLGDHLHQRQSRVQIFCALPRTVPQRRHRSTASGWRRRRPTTNTSPTAPCSASDGRNQERNCDARTGKLSPARTARWSIKLFLGTPTAPPTPSLPI